MFTQNVVGASLASRRQPLLRHPAHSQVFWPEGRGVESGDVRQRSTRRGTAFHGNAADAVHEPDASNRSRSLHPTGTRAGREQRLPGAVMHRTGGRQ